MLVRCRLERQRIYCRPILTLMPHFRVKYFCLPKMIGLESVYVVVERVMQQ